MRITSGARGRGQGTCDGASSWGAASLRATPEASFALPAVSERAKGPPPCPLPLAPLLVLLLALLLSLPAFAQSGRIQVEVLVFAYNNPETGSALAPSDDEPVYSGMLLGEGGSLYSALPPEALKLGGANSALARHARTRALVHTGWQQDAGSIRAVRLRGSNSVRGSNAASGALATELPELDGDLELRFGRGVEAHVDVLLRLPTRDSAGRPSGEQRFRLNSRRIMNYGELHYLDHPALGVIVRVDPVQGTEPAEAQAQQ